MKTFLYEGEGLDFQIFPKFPWLKYGLDFDDTCDRYLWNIGNIYIMI